MRVKLINLNTWQGGKFLWDNIIQYLKDEQPDIVMLQEVFASEEENVAPYLKTLESLQEIFNFPYSEYSLEAIFDNGEEIAPMGNAILSKFPLSDKQVIWINGTAPTTMDNNDRGSIPNFPRNILHCQIDINSQTYNLMTTHGVWAPDSIETDLQKAMGKRISEYVNGKPNVILTGDFNVNENTEAIYSIEQHLTNLFKDERDCSFNMKHKTKPGYATAVVDFIFTSPNITVLEHRTSEADVSDHQSQVVICDL